MQLLIALRVGIDDVINATKTTEVLFSMHKNTWHIESNYISQPPKLLHTTYLPKQ